MLQSPKTGYKTGEIGTGIRPPGRFSCYALFTINIGSPNLATSQHFTAQRMVCFIKTALYIGGYRTVSGDMFVFYGRYGRFFYKIFEWLSNHSCPWRVSSLSKIYAKIGVSIKLNIPFRWIPMSNFQNIILNFQKFVKTFGYSTSESTLSSTHYQAQRRTFRI